jgi:hypothetical protein
LVFNESWLNTSHLDGEFTPAGWVAFRRDRAASGDTRRGGGVLILVRASLNPQDVVIDDLGLEQLWVKITLFDKRIYIGAAYLPPRSDAEQISKLATTYQLINQMLSERDEAFIFCDLNLPGLIWVADDEISDIFHPTNASSAAEIALCDELLSCGLFQLNGLVNRRNHLLETIFSSCYDHAKTFLPTIPLCNGFGLSEFHVPVVLQYDYVPVAQSRATPAASYNFSKANYKAISRELSLINWEETLAGPDVDVMVENFYSTLDVIFSRHVSRKVNKMKNNRPWMSPRLIRLRTQKRNIARRVARFNHLDDTRLLAELQRRFNSLNLDDYHRYAKSLADGMKANPKKFWDYVNERRGTNHLPLSMFWNDRYADSESDVANLLADYFASIYHTAPSNVDACSFTPHATVLTPINHDVTEAEVLQLITNLDANKGAGPDKIPPRFYKAVASDISAPLTIIFGQSLRSCTFPLAWKLSTVTPIHKGSNRSDVRNYRPISILSCAAKMLDNLMSKRLSAAFSSVLTGPQHAYKETLSTTTNLVEFVSKITNLIESGEQVEAVYLDFAKAFDSINHCTLTAKLELYGLNADTITWIKSYLHGRTQQVRVNGSLSAPFLTSSGVPQGSHLGPILFNIYIEDLLHRFTNVECSAYADDIKVYKSIRDVNDYETLQAALRMVYGWGEVNSLHLNLTKCNVICFTRKRIATVYDFNVNGTQLARVSQVVDLGVLLKRDMCFNGHIELIVSKAMSVLGLVKRFSRSLCNMDVTRLLYCSLVRSKLEYASVVWNTHHSTYSHRIESVQKKFLLFAAPCPRDPVTFALPPYVERLKWLKLQPLWVRRLTSSALFIHDLLMQRIKHIPLRELIDVRTGSRTRGHEYIHVPRHRTDYGKFEPINFGRIAFNGISHLFLLGHSRRSLKMMADDHFLNHGRDMFHINF